MYKDTQRYICKPCARLTKRAYRSQNVHTIDKSVHTESTQNVHTENKLVDTPFVATKQQLIDERKAIIESITAKPDVHTITEEEDDDVQIVSLKDEVPDFYV